MKVFVSGQLNNKEEIREIYKSLENLGFEITHDWTKTDNVIDRLANKKECGNRAAKDITGVVDCDIYILVSSNQKPGKGMYVELGAALALKKKTGKPDIYIIGPLNHLSIFYLHPGIKRFTTLEQLLEKLKS